jgi:hypothetical protein
LFFCYFIFFCFLHWLYFMFDGGLGFCFVAMITNGEHFFFCLNVVYCVTATRILICIYAKTVATICKHYKA